MLISGLASALEGEGIAGNAAALRKLWLIKPDEDTAAAFHLLVDLIAARLAPPRKPR